jgi:hypothetical protein
MVLLKQNFSLSVFICHSPYFLNDKLVPFAEHFVSEITAVLFYLKNWLKFLAILPF